MGIGFKFQTGMGMGMKSLKWERIGTKNLFPHTSTAKSSVNVQSCNFSVPVRITPQAVVFIGTAAAISSLGHGLSTFTAVPISTQPAILRGTVKLV